MTICEKCEGAGVIFTFDGDKEYCDCPEAELIKAEDDADRKAEANRD